MHYIQAYMQLQLITKGRQRKSYKQKLSDAAKSYREIGSILAVALERSRSAQIPNVQKGVRAQTNLSNASSKSKRSESSIVPTILKIASPTRQATASEKQSLWIISTIN